MSGPATLVSPVQLLSATTTDSKSITIDYRVNALSPYPDSIQLGIYRSSSSQFNSSDVPVATITLASPNSVDGQGAITLDDKGQGATSLGTHEITLPLIQGLAPSPEKPYIVVVADPHISSSTLDAEQTTSFRIYTIGIVTHGGIQDPSWKHGPPWQLETAYMMRHEGFDAVIAYNWALQSSTPGAAIKQSPKLARMILNTASTFPANAPVDLEFIGHSEGNVVNTYAIVKLESGITPQLAAGDIEDILLDPHAANNSIPGQQMSFGGLLGGLARDVVSNYQARANDPPVFIPPVVDQALVFFQHSQATASGIYNLWGQVPVKSTGPMVHYYNLTDMGVTHSGKTGVNYWFRDFIAPTLGGQMPLIQELQLNGQITNALPLTTSLGGGASRPLRAQSTRANRVYGPEQVVYSNQPVFSGTAAPGSMIRLGLSPATRPSKLKLAGATRADNTGHWSLTTWRPLQNGDYRTLVTAFSRSLTTRPALAMIPTQPLGRLAISAPTSQVRLS
jgi:hypothetical protein